MKGHHRFHNFLTKHINPGSQGAGSRVHKHGMSVLAPAVKKQSVGAQACGVRNKWQDKSPQQLSALLREAIDCAAAYFATHTQIEGSNALLKKMRADLASIEQHQNSSSPDSIVGEDNAMAAAYQGITNNLRGFLGEIEAMQYAPGVKAVCKKFHSMPCCAPPPPDTASAAQRRAALNQRIAQKQQRKQQQQQQQQQQNRETRQGEVPAPLPAAELDQGTQQGLPGTSQFNAQGKGLPQQQAQGQSIHQLEPSREQQQQQQQQQQPQTVEVDVVACDGSCWVEVKAQEAYGIDSPHWERKEGSSGHGKGLKQQVEELMAVARAPCNARRWQPPNIALYFPSGQVGSDVAEALQSMGVFVALGPDALQRLPPPPPPPTITNLDTTTLCALVSEVSHAPPQDPTIQAWAARTIHWRDCAAAEAEAPLLPSLQPYLSESRQLIAADVAVAQFEKLLSMFGGPKERQRWGGLKQRLHIEPTRSQTQLASERVKALGTLKEVGQHQVAVLGLGDTRRALTLTANTAAIRSAAQQGVWLEAATHRAAWLVGA